MFFVILLNSLSTYFICSFFENLFIFFIVYFALIVLNCEILSLFKAFNSQNILIVSIIELILITFILIKSKKKFYKPHLDKFIFKKLSLDKYLIFYFSCFLFMILCFGFLAFFNLPLEPDNRMYHFIRIFEYIKQESFNHFDTNMLRNIVMPVNSEMIYSYFYLFKNNDIGFGLLSYISSIFMFFGIFNILTELKFSFRQSIFTAIAIFSIPIILIQIPSLQTEIVCASLIICSIYLFILGNKKENLLYFSSLSYALALGVKTSAIFNLISFFIIIFSYITIYKKNFKILYRFLLYLIINFIIFSSYNYILNYLQFGNFITNLSMKNEHLIGNGFNEIKYNFTHVLKDFLNPFIINLNDERKTSLSLFSIVILLNILYLLFLYFKKNNKKIKFITIISLTFILNFVLILTSITYSQYLMRFFLTFVVMGGFGFVYLYKTKFKKLIIIFSSLIFIIYSFLSQRCPLYYYFNADFKNIKDYIINKKLKYTPIYEQYDIKELFLKKFSKEDKIGVINDSLFYEAYQIKDYNITPLRIENLLNDEILNYFDYIVFSSYSQFDDNIENFNPNIYTKNLYCVMLNRKIKSKTIPLVKKCYFTNNLLIDNGYKEIMMGKMYIFKKQ